MKCLICRTQSRSFIHFSSFPMPYTMSLFICFPRLTHCAYLNTTISEVTHLRKTQVYIFPFASEQENPKYWAHTL